MTDPKTPTETPPAEPEAQRVETLDARFGKIETEQAEQRGMLQTILDKVTGGPGPAAKDAPETQADRSASISDQVRQAVKDVGAEEARKKAEEEHAAHHAALRAGTPEPEKPPRERQGGFKSKLQHAMYGGDK